MNSIEFKENKNDWDVAQFIVKHGGMFNDFDDHFAIWQQNKPFVRFKDGDTIIFENDEFKVIKI